jgi:hypothetical protein
MITFAFSGLSISPEYAPVILKTQRKKINSAGTFTLQWELPNQPNA